MEVQPPNHAARQLVDDAQQAYETALRSAGLVDFSLLEDEVLSEFAPANSRSSPTN